MSAIVHYKSPQSSVTTVCGKGLHKLTVSHSTRPESVTCARCQKHQDVIRAHAQAVDNAISKSPDREALRNNLVELATKKHSYSLAEIRNGTGFDRGVRFQQVEPQREKRTVTISFEIEPDAAWELAQFCKRLTWSHFAECAVGKDNAYVMRDAHGLLYAALREAGFNPR